MTHPYQNLDEFQFWQHGMTDPAPGHIDPVVRSKTILKTEKVATIGSCFAQHLGRNISKSGFNYFVAETCDQELPPEIARSRNYGVFSARYGNVYTVRQAVQLFDRAFGQFQPGEHIWRSGSKFVDAFRPRIEPDGFSRREEAISSRETHLSCVRKVFEDCDWLIFTLGLTEAWRSRSDGAIFPLAPGVHGGEFDPQAHEFVNFGASEVSHDLGVLVSKLASVNAAAQVLLTLSPVPLIATYEKRHVLVSTTFSKSALRVAADDAERNFRNVIYFPAYEIITSAANGGRYFEDDLRNVSDIGVNHVMRVFSKHFMHRSEAVSQKVQPIQVQSDDGDSADVVCDEEEIRRAIKSSGF
jgi:hypothetical protein